jgi:hypothetical protein
MWLTDYIWKLVMVTAIDIFESVNQNLENYTPNLQFLSLLSGVFEPMWRIQVSPCGCSNVHGTLPTKSYQARFQILNVFVMNYILDIICLGKISLFKR